MKTIGYFLDAVDATEEDHEEYVRGLIMKYGPRCFFCIFEGHFKSDCNQFWDAVADANTPAMRSRARLMNEAESRKKEVTTGTFTTKKVKTLPDETISSRKVDNGLVARTALQNVQQELATKGVEQWVRSKLENTELREKLDILGGSTKEEDNQKPRKQGLKLNVISGKTLGMKREGSKIMSRLYRSRAIRW